MINEFIGKDITKVKGKLYSLVLSKSEMVRLLQATDSAEVFVLETRDKSKKDKFVSLNLVGKLGGLSGNIILEADKKEVQENE